MPWNAETPEEKQAIRERFLKFYRLGFPELSRSWWEMDHIVEVVNGGGGCGLDNLQTLCVVCHKAKTKRLMAQLARNRKQANQSKLPFPDLTAKAAS
jgi:hypothetical protein